MNIDGEDLNLLPIFPKVKEGEKMKKMLVTMIMAMLIVWIVTLKDGTVYKGKTVKNVSSYSSQTSILLSQENGVEISIPWDSIKSITRAD
jgi:hypothetical protein